MDIGHGIRSDDKQNEKREKENEKNIENVKQTYTQREKKLVKTFINNLLNI